MLISVMSQQYNCLMELYTNFTKCLLPSTFILRYVGAKMIVHAFMIELDQLEFCVYKVNGELLSCDITDSGIFLSRGGDIQNFA